MSSSDPLVAAVLDAVAKAPGPRLVQVMCTQTSPLKVAINGQGSVPAKAMAGSTFALNDMGYAVWQPPLPPHCYKVT